MKKIALLTALIVMTVIPMFGQFKLEISVTGYKPCEQTVSFQLQMVAGSVLKQASTDPGQAIGA